MGLIVVIHDICSLIFLVDMTFQTRSSRAKHLQHTSILDAVVQESWNILGQSWLSFWLHGPLLLRLLLLSVELPISP